MKINKLFFAAAVLMALTACNSDDIPMLPTEERIPVRLAYTTVEASETRAAQNLHEGMFDPGDSLMVRISTTGADSWTDYTFITGEDGALIPKNAAPYYPPEGHNIDISAFYPTPKKGGAHLSQMGLTISLMDGQMTGNLHVQPDQTTDASYKASDLMYAFVTDQATQTEPVKLVFKHAMAKICVNATPGEGVGSITGVSIPKVKYLGYANPATGECGAREGYYGAVTMSNNGAAVIPPQTINGNLLIIETDKGQAIYNVDNKTFAAGHVYTLNINVNLDAIGGTISITGWTDDEPLSVNPEGITVNIPARVEAVDLGLSVLWANMDVGATSETEKGTLFAWGETSGKTHYGWDNYAWCMGSDNTLTKYCLDFSSLHGDGIYDYWFDKTGSKAKPDGKTALLPGDDAAHVNWGGKWRMPTHGEVVELLQKCKWVGSWVYNKDDNNKRIYINGTWSSDAFPIPPNLAYVLNEKDGVYEYRTVDRCYGFPVRPVMPKE